MHKKMSILIVLSLFAASLSAGDMRCKAPKKRSLSSRRTKDVCTKRPRLNPADCLFHMSFLNNTDAGAFAIEHGQRGRLGEGKEGKVKKAQSLDGGSSWVAVKIQGEQFAEEEIEGCMRTGQLIAPPVKYYDQRGQKRYAYLQEYIRGNNAWDWLEANDPNQSFSIEQVRAFKNKIIDALAEQVHEQLMVVCDSNLDNIMIEPNGAIRFIDYGNALIYNIGELSTVEDEEEFAAYRDQDILMMDAALYHYLNEQEYPEPVQEAIWNDMYREAVSVFAVYKENKRSPFAYDEVLPYLLQLTAGRAPQCLKGEPEVQKIHAYLNFVPSARKATQFDNAK